MAHELPGEQSISPIEVDGTSNVLRVVAPWQNSTVTNNIPPDGFHPNIPRHSSISSPDVVTGSMSGPHTTIQTHDGGEPSHFNSPRQLIITDTQATSSPINNLSASPPQQGHRTSDTEVLIPRNQSSNSLLPVPIPGPDPESEYRVRQMWWEIWHLRWADPKHRYWCFILTPLTVVLLVVVVVVLALWQTSKGGGHINISFSTVTEVKLPQAAALPRSNSGLGAATVDLASIFSSADASTSESIVAYIDTSPSPARLCIRKKSDKVWLGNVQCITSENVGPKPDSPVSVLDWVGGPSIYFITEENMLSGIDWVPQNSTWKLSSLAAQKKLVYKQSQLASVTWLNGTSAWLYYQDSTSQLREFGIDDFRDELWRDGSVGALGLAQDGTGIGASRWMSDGSEVMEIFCQATNGAIHGRVYRNSVWSSEFYAVQGTPGMITQGASMTATTVNQKNGSVVLLAYVENSGFLTTQFRETVNITTDYSGFSAPKRLVEGDGKISTGLAAVGTSGEPRVYFVVNQKILELSGTDVAAANWTTVDVISV
ncbi:hypothetical protein BKA65DRAFT_487723 [Rhexocercosporidium sp. MPI-PUGE-AT-0058]|nr:hypothetical protein BKA65DRAFT_487723 [Rhexocercosporidium sp. MPI-PUGE-AT-0058]